jgi:hypothetical protein
MMAEAASAGSASGNQAPRSSGLLRRAGRITLILGNLLLVASLFAPWLDVTGNDFGRSPVWIHYNYGPSYLLRHDLPDQAFGLLDAPLLVIVGSMIVVSTCTCALLAPHIRQTQGAFLFMLVVFSCVAFVAILFVILKAVPFWLSFGYPSYGSVPSYGVWLALAGFSGVCLGALVAAPAPHPTA